ncbi:unnamed protein product, partial [Ectocarpus sp. 6 AP-2014]
RPSLLGEGSFVRACVPGGLIGSRKRVKMEPWGSSSSSSSHYQQPSLQFTSTTTAVGQAERGSAAAEEAAAAAAGGGGGVDIDFDFEILANYLTEEGQQLGRGLAVPPTGS